LNQAQKICGVSKSATGLYSIQNTKERGFRMANDGPETKKNPPASMSMIEPRIRNIYLSFYKESYFAPSALDLKTKELIAIGCSLVAKCEGCLEGHIKKALELGVTKHEISDAIVVAIGIAAAGVMDFSDKTAIKLDLHHFE
jgi:AhpD family alkylhydroperoxidase